MLPQQLFSPVAQHAIQVAVQAYHQVRYLACLDEICAFIVNDGDLCAQAPLIRGLHR